MLICSKFNFYYTKVAIFSLPTNIYRLFSMKNCFFIINVALCRICCLLWRTLRLSELDIIARNYNLRLVATGVDIAPTHSYRALLARK